MCRSAHALLSTAICGVQMLVRVILTTFLMVENLLRMCLQTLYNFISFMLQLISLIPICCVFLITSRMKCFMCGGGGPCPVNRGGACDCLMSLFAIIILFLIFRATGVLDKIFYSIGYAKATTYIVRFSPTTGSITECSRNDTDTEYVFYPLDTTANLKYFYIDYTEKDENPRIFREGTDMITETFIWSTTEIETELKEIITKSTTETETTIVEAPVPSAEEDEDDMIPKVTRTKNAENITSAPPKVKLRTETDDNYTDIMYENTVPDLQGTGIFDWTTILYYLS